MPSNTQEPRGDQTSFGGIMSSLSTGGVQNIEKAFSRGGAGNQRDTPLNHTPGTASSLGNEGSTNVQTASAKASARSAGDRESHEPSAIGKMVDKMLNGKEIGK